MVKSSHTPKGEQPELLFVYCLFVFLTQIDDIMIFCPVYIGQLQYLPPALDSLGASPWIDQGVQRLLDIINIVVAIAGQKLIVYTAMADNNILMTLAIAGC